MSELRPVVAAAARSNENSNGRLTVRGFAGLIRAALLPLPDGERITDDNGDELERGMDSEGSR